MNTTDRIAKHLEKRGSIDPLQALSRYGCFRLAARINDLRNAGVNIKTAKQKLPSGKTIAKYTLA